MVVPGIDPRMRDLRLRDFHPRSSLRAAEHLVPRAKFAAIDSHNHLGRWLTRGGGWSVPDVPELLASMDASNVRAIVNLDGRFGDELEANLDRYDRTYPGWFVTFCHLDWRETASVAFAARLSTSVRRSASAGAAGLKVWKDLGLHVRDDRGALLMPNDPRLSDVWDVAGDIGMPISIHTADPVSFFEPADETNERLEELLEHPDWSFSDRKRFPPFERLMEALEAMVAEHPRTTFIGVHVGCYAEDLNWVERMLDEHANFHIDIAARVPELGRQPRAARRLILKHPKRVLFGTDEFPPRADAYATHFRFLETGDESFAYSDDPVPPQGRWAISGLDLPEEALRAVYAENALRLIPGLAR